MRKQVDDSQNPVMSVNTGLHTKDETSETIVKYVYRLFSYIMIPCNCKLVFPSPNQ